ncbi:MAG: low molecular weight phosphatase family protein [Paracoccaceae bacterium]|nr:low molecular weight phosphatase family protein [Paracoccaceae bacterium]MDE2917798.1 low molecular weight phosphatase family protein [Paracoccaceae bacterium]
MVPELPSSVLFCCDQNCIRSPMAEGIMKKLFGTSIYVQSAGVLGDREIDGFAIAVCQEIGVELSNHRSRSMEQMEDWGDDMASFELVIALTPAAQRLALERTRYMALEVEYWPTLDPAGMGEKRNQKLEYYRTTRDQIYNQIKKRFSV